jgi:hypothetical protein
LKKSDFTLKNPAFMLDLKDYNIWQIEASFFTAIGWTRAATDP